MGGSEVTERAPGVLARNSKGERAVGVGIVGRAPPPNLDIPSKGGPWGFQHLSGQELSLLEQGGWDLFWSAQGRRVGPATPSPRSSPSSSSMDRIPFSCSGETKVRPGQAESFDLIIHSSPSHFFPAPHLPQPRRWKSRLT